MNKYLIFGGITTILVTLLFLLSSQYIKVRNDRDRISKNQTSLLKDFEVNEQENKLTVEKLILTKKEIKVLLESNTNLSDKIKDAGIKIKRLESVIETKLKVEVPIKEVFRDSIINKIDTIRCLKIDNEFLFIDICDNIESDNLIIIPIELDQFGEVVPKKFIFRWILWGIESIKATTITDNPYVKIKYNRYIEIKK